MRLSSCREVPEALERISKFLRWPPTVSKLNAEAFAALEVAEPNGVDEPRFDRAFCCGIDATKVETAIFFIDVQ